MGSTATVRCRFPGREDQLPRVRAFVRHALAAHPTRDTAELLVSEVATNAIWHTKSGTPDGSFLVTLRFDCDYARIDVDDEGGPTLPHVLPDPGDGEFGRGLLLVHELADSWGFETREAGGRVWLVCSSGASRAG